MEILNTLLEPDRISAMSCEVLCVEHRGVSRMYDGSVNIRENRNAGSRDINVPGKSDDVVEDGGHSVGVVGKWDVHRYAFGTSTLQLRLENLKLGEAARNDTVRGAVTILIRKLSQKNSRRASIPIVASNRKGGKFFPSYDRTR